MRALTVAAIDFYSRSAIRSPSAPMEKPRRVEMTKRATVSMVLVACSLAAAGCGDASGGASRRPNRLVVLGDSIAACSNLGGKDDPACSARMLAGYLQMKFAPDLRYD